jgi:hypothetical protein
VNVLSCLDPSVTVTLACVPLLRPLVERDRRSVKPAAQHTNVTRRSASYNTKPVHEDETWYEIGDTGGERSSGQSIRETTCPDQDVRARRYIGRLIMDDATERLSSVGT